MTERDYWAFRICDLLSQMDVRLLRMVWAYARRLHN